VIVFVIGIIVVITIVVVVVVVVYGIILQATLSIDWLLSLTVINLCWVLLAQFKRTSTLCM